MKTPAMNGLVALISVLLICNIAPTRGGEFAPYLSVISVAGAPKNFDKQVVFISGWLSLAIESGVITEAYLFPSPEHLRVSDFPSAITLDPVSLQYALKARYPKTPSKSMRGAYAVFKGTFRGSDLKVPGNLGLGELTDITKVSQMSLSERK